MSKISKKVVDTYGKDVQINHAFEKMAELIVAINHWIRGQVTKADVLSEIADVVIMCDQLCYIVGETEEGAVMCADIITDIIDQKLKRQEKRINEYLDKQKASANTQKTINPVTE